MTKKIISTILALAMLFTLFVVKEPSAYAKDIEYTSINQLLDNNIQNVITTTQGNLIYEVDSETFDKISANALPTVVVEIAIFFGGLLVGAFIDGVLVVESGQSMTGWASDAYRWVRSGAIKLFVNSTKVLYGVSPTGCTKTTAYGVWVCPY